MKSITLLLLGCLFSGVVLAQLSPEKLSILFDKTDSLLLAYNNTVSLSELGANKFSDRVANAHLMLFKENAEVANEIVPQLLENNFKEPYRRDKLPVADYIELLRKHFPKAFWITISGADLDVSGLNKGTVNIYLRKEIKGTSSGGYEFLSKSVELMVINFDPKNISLPLKISEIRQISSDLTVLNDKDGDLVINEKDKCPNIAGLQLNVACPPSLPKFYAMPMLLLGSAGLNTEFNSMTQGYENSEEAQAAKLPDNLNSMAMGGGLKLQYMLGRKARFGFSAGFTFMSSSYTIEPGSFSIESKATDFEQTTYKQIISSDNYKEEGRFKSIGIPIELIYKHQLKDKLQLMVTAGINSYSLSMKGSATGDFYYEARYSFSNGLEYSPEDGNNDLVLSRDKLSSGEMEALRAEGYNTGLDKERTADYGSTKKGSGISPIVSAGINYVFPSRMALAVGLTWTGLNIKDIPVRNEPMTLSASENDLNSLQSSIKSIQGRYISLSIGLLIPIL